MLNPVASHGFPAEFKDLLSSNWLLRLSLAVVDVTYRMCEHYLGVSYNYELVDAIGAHAPILCSIYP